jgi:hypothetical protein
MASLGLSYNAAITRSITGGDGMTNNIDQLFQDTNTFLGLLEVRGKERSSIDEGGIE